MLLYVSLTKPDTRTTSSAEDAGGPSSGLRPGDVVFPADHPRPPADRRQPAIWIRREDEAGRPDQLDPFVQVGTSLGVNSPQQAERVSDRGVEGLVEGNASVWMRAGKSRRTLPIWSSGRDLQVQAVGVD